ncbi:MAG: RNase A-like domain-containing protein [Candidatus Acidiferrales bacterium]
MNVRNPFGAVALGLIGAALCACGGAQTPTTPAANSEVAASAQASGASEHGSAHRYNLERDEERGGHTLKKHVGRTDQELRERLDRERNISAASTWTNRELAEEAVNQTLQHNSKLERWLDRGGRKPNLVLDYHGSPSHPVGRCVARGSTEAVPAYDALIVLKAYGDRDFYVLTTYPECPR